MFLHRLKFAQYFASTLAVSFLPFLSQFKMGTFGNFFIINFQFLTSSTALGSLTKNKINRLLFIYLLRGKGGQKNSILTWFTIIPRWIIYSSSKWTNENETNILLLLFYLQQGADGFFSPLVSLFCEISYFLWKISLNERLNHITKIQACSC